MFQKNKIVCSSVEKLCLKSVAVFVREEPVGQVVPDLPAQSRAFLLRWHDVGVWFEDSPRFRLQHRHGTNRRYCLRVLICICIYVCMYTLYVYIYTHYIFIIYIYTYILYIRKT